MESQLSQVIDLQNQRIQKGKNKSWVTSIVPHDKNERLKGTQHPSSILLQPDRRGTSGWLGHSTPPDRCLGTSMCPTA